MTFSCSYIDKNLVFVLTESVFNQPAVKTSWHFDKQSGLMQAFCKMSNCDFSSYSTLVCLEFYSASSRWYEAYICP